MQQSNQFLGTDPIPRLLRRLAVPTVTAQLINMLYNIVDRIYIGHMPVNGALALTGGGGVYAGHHGRYRLCLAGRSRWGTPRVHRHGARRGRRGPKNTGQLLFVSGAPFAVAQRGASALGQAGFTGVWCK